MPKGFQFGYCVDAQGNSYFYMGPKGIIVWSSELEEKSVIKPKGGLGAGTPLAAKMAIDRRNNQLYLQTYEPQLREELLHRVDLRSHESKVVYQLRNAPKTIPTYGPGMFDWTIGNDRLFISDFAEYKITSFSLGDGRQIGIFNRPFTIRPINAEDSRLQSAGWDLPYILKSGAMVNYPAIWKILATDDGKLLAFTSDRDASNRQIVHVYDRNFQFLGTDLKYFRPGLNNHLANGGLVYVADCSGNGKTLPSRLSPLDTPELAHRLKVFRLR
jgi:outer membrane protein assembly factor BamB